MLHNLLNDKAGLLLFVSANLLLGATFPAWSQSCATQGTNAVAKAEQLLKDNRSREAYSWLNLGREQGSGEAFRKAASLFEQGRGVIQSDLMVRHLNWMGAQWSDPEAMYRTALDFYGRGFPQDGLYWATRAKDCGNDKALVLLLEKSIYDGRNVDAQALIDEGMGRSITQVKFIKAEQLEKGGVGYLRDLNSAFVLYYDAAKAGNPKAMNAVAYFFVRGLHGVKSDIAAIHWYHESAKRGDADGAVAYAWMLERGLGAQKDSEEAKYYFAKAVRTGSGNAVSIPKNVSPAALNN